MEVVWGLNVVDRRDNTGVHQNGAQPPDILGVHCADKSLEQSWRHWLWPIGGHDKIDSSILVSMPVEVLGIPLPHKRQQQRHGRDGNLCPAQPFHFCTLARDHPQIRTSWPRCAQALMRAHEGILRLFGVLLPRLQRHSKTERNAPKQ